MVDFEVVEKNPKKTNSLVLVTLGIVAVVVLWYVYTKYFRKCPNGQIKTSNDSCGCPDGQIMEPNGTCSKPASPACSNHGFKKNNICVCSQGWLGPDCSVPCKDTVTYVKGANYAGVASNYPNWGETLDLKCNDGDAVVAVCSGKAGAKECKDISPDNTGDSYDAMIMCKKATTSSAKTVAGTSKSSGYTTCLMTYAGRDFELPLTFDGQGKVTPGGSSSSCPSGSVLNSLNFNDKGEIAYDYNCHYNNEISYNITNTYNSGSSCVVAPSGQQPKDKQTGKLDWVEAVPSTSVPNFAESNNNSKIIAACPAGQAAYGICRNGATVHNTFVQGQVPQSLLTECNNNQLFTANAQTGSLALGCVPISSGC